MYVTGFFLVFAGMLIGYFLWYRDRSAEEALHVSMTRENEDLRTSLKLAHNSHEKLDERFARQKGQLNVLQQLCDDWSSSREQAERDRAQLESEVADKNRRYEEAIGELQIEKQNRISLEDKAHQLTQQQIEKLSLLEDEWRNRHAKIESSLFQRQADLKSTSGEKDRISKQLQSSEEKIAELQAELATQKSLLDTTTKHASGFEQEFVSVETSLKEHSELL
jgi:chromosome segregation ATPase